MAKNVDQAGAERLDENYSAGEDLRRAGRESPLRAIVHIAIITAICGAAGVWYWGYVQNSNKITELVKEARDLQKADDFSSLQKSRERYVSALTIRNDNRAVAGLAMTAASLWGLHGLNKVGDVDLKAEAEKYVKMAQEADIPNGDRFAAAGYMDIFSGNPQKAEADLRAVLNKGAASPKVLDAVGVALMMQGKTREARTAFRKAIDMSAGASRYSAAMGDAYFRDGDYSNAWTFYNRAVVANAEHVHGRVGRILAKAKDGGDLEKFTKELKGILEEPAERLSPKDRSFAEYASAEVALAKGDRKQAATFVEAALARDDKDARLHYLKGLLLSADKKTDAALAEFDKSIALDPYTAAPYFDAADMLRDAGRPSDAVDRIRAYGQKNFKSDDYQARLGMALADKGELAEAEKIFAKLVEEDEYNADALFGQGYVFELQQQWDKAREAYGTADQRRTGWGDPYWRMGYVALGEKDFATAREYFEESVKRYKKTKAPTKSIAKAYQGIAQAWEKQGKKKKAKAARDKAEKLLK